ncbi:DEAD/DEAH box helicase [Antarcticibacterium arcticum]|uniref:DEAD/DEAH box helicase n=1 Tax=Antarcticibacterium arcticum TaxID=2585771 RepID=A0A5B8YFH5_9FLAO|nr:DEAD/DEAH box helicase family protein [Antarcticibacterium arcticum]QED36690.1 DEAD/DEAH box helicase [Antarcticibacterium arcticum]
MEQDNLQHSCNNIIELIRFDERGLIYRKYENFLNWFGMGGRRKFEVIEQIDTHFKKNNISIWKGRKKLNSVADFKRGETITLRYNGHKRKETTMNVGKEKVSNNDAGTISVVNEDSGIRLYKHQEEAIQKLHSQIRRSNGNIFSGLLVLPTGGGKTLTAAYWLAQNYLAEGKKVLWIAHRHELLEQAKATFHERLAYKDVFGKKSSFNYRIISGIHDKPVNIKPTDDLVISSKDSLNSGFDHLYNNWLKGQDEVFLVIDEAHHATAKTYKKLIEKIGEKVSKFKILGLTATPFRTAENEQGALQKVFTNDIIYKVDLRTLIARGILSEPVFEEIQTDFDMTSQLTEKQLDNLKYFDIESIGKDVADSIAKNSQRNAVIVNQYLKEKLRYKQTLVFALNVNNAIALKSLFNDRGIKADFVVSAIKDRITGSNISQQENKEKIDQFRRGDIEVLINVNILTEGTDLPEVQTIFLARPTISSILMTQMIGRGLRGLKAGGTEKAFIVSFIDDWKDKVSWVNPEQLIVEEHIDNTKDSGERNKHLTRLISLQKIEEFALLANNLIDEATRKKLTSLDFIERIPLGIYHFSLLKHLVDEELEKNCEILIYNNIEQSYIDFMNGLPFFFKHQSLSERDDLTENDLNDLEKKVEELFFFGCEKYPGYSEQDIKDVLLFYAQTGEIPKYIEFQNRENFNVTRIAQDIYSKDLRQSEAMEFKNELWESNETEWKAFFGYKKEYFLNEVDLAIRKVSNPELFKKSSILPTDTKELRPLEKLSMHKIREFNPQYWKYLSDKIYEKNRDKDGYYVSATGNFRSKNKLDFQIDHIIPISYHGLTVEENLQLLTRSENGLKGAGEL